mgnify:CR=1 FL=1
MPTVAVLSRIGGCDLLRLPGQAYGLFFYVQGVQLMKNAIRLFTLSLFFLFSPLALAEVVNINTADAQTLADNIIGVGMKRAQEIINFREEHGPFKSVDELTQIKGIGLKLVEQNRDNLKVSEKK